MQRYLKVPCWQSGFNLITVSVLVVAASLVMVSMLPGEQAGSNNQKSVSSIQKLDKVELAMQGFVLANGRRPCPAEGQYDINTGSFGKESANPGTCTGGTPAAPLGPNNNVIGGVIPTKTLGLPDEYAFDEWGRRFTYVVDQRATQTASCLALQKYPANSGKGGVSIIQKDSNGNTLGTDNTMYAYISHGPDGHGAWPEQGGTTRINSGSIDADTLVNASVDSNFNTVFTNTRIRKDRTPIFDDILYYRDDLKNTCCTGAACHPTIAGIRLDGTVASQEIGYYLTTGDVNGDGIKDLIASAQNGTIYVLFGKTSGWTSPILVSSLDGFNGFTLTSAAVTDAVVATGDVNGDGFDDIIIGDQSASPGGRAQAGSVHVVFGKANGWAASATVARRMGRKVSALMMLPRGNI